MKTYKEITDYICGCRRFGTASGKEITEEFFALLNFEKPENMHIFHIAGTNGKGSTAAFMQSILQSMGYVVGTFTSPHLVDYTERIMVNGARIPEADVARIGQMLVEKAKVLSNSPTMFDYCTVMAMIYFSQMNCDYVILETGLGGEMDSTNAEVLNPDMSIITSIGLEHTQVLGTNIKSIARAKAGIIKPNQQVVYGDVPPEAEAVIFARAMAYGIFAKKADPIDPGTKLGLFGAYQRKNAAVAVTAIKEYFNRRNSMSDEQKNILEQAIEQGLAAAKWPGRMEIVSESPFIMLDGAHNPQGVEALRDSLMEAFPGEKFSFIVGVMADKDYRAMMRRLWEITDCFYTVTVGNERSLAAKELADMLTESGYNAVACENLEEALNKATEDEKLRTIICGSLYFIGECEKTVKKVPF